MIDCVKLQPHFYVFNLTTIGAFLALFGPFWSCFGVGVMFKNFLGPTYVNNQLWFWKYSPILLFLIQPHFGPLLHFFWAFWGYFLGPFGLFFVALWGYSWGQYQVQNTFLEPTNVDYQFLLWKCSPIFLILIRPNLGAFLASIRPVRAIFEIGVRFKKVFWTCLCIQSTLVLEVHPYCFVFESATFWASFAHSCVQVRQLASKDTDRSWCRFQGFHRQAQSYLDYST